MQKLLKLEGVEMKAEEEPEEETIVGSSREAMRPLGMDIIFFQISFLSVQVCWTAAPLIAFLYQKLFGC